MKINADFIQSQTSYLKDLIGFKDHPANLDNRDKIGWQDWEYDRLVTITRKDVLAVLNRVLSGDLSIKDYYDWAISISGRDTIGFEKGYGAVIDGVLSYILADYPTREDFPIPADYVQNLIQKIENAQFDLNEDDE